ncbi:MAG: hypothetical protein V1871_08235 [Planctomycetota bacterium]
MIQKIWFSVAIILTIVIVYFSLIDYYQDIPKERKILRENKENIGRMISNQYELPSQLWIERYNKWRAELGAETVVCKDYYKDIDRTLGKWFPGLTVGKNGLVPESDFKIKYLSEKNAIIKLLKNKKLYGIFKERNNKEQSIEDGKDLGFDEPTANNIRKLQKQFWIQQKLFSDIIGSNVAKCEKLTFPVSNTSQVTFLYGSIITFHLTVFIQNKDIPILVYNILKFQENKKDISFAILLKNISISRLTEEINNLPEIKELERVIPETEKNGYKLSPIKSPLSRLSLEGEVLDFNF